MQAWHHGRALVCSAHPWTCLGPPWKYKPVKRPELLLWMILFCPVQGSSSAAFQLKPHRLKDYSKRASHANVARDTFVDDGVCYGAPPPLPSQVFGS